MKTSLEARVMIAKVPGQVLDERKRLIVLEARHGLPVPALLRPLRYKRETPRARRRVRISVNSNVHTSRTRH